MRACMHHLCHCVCTLYIPVEKYKHLHERMKQARSEGWTDYLIKKNFTSVCRQDTRVQEFKENG